MLWRPNHRIMALIKAFLSENEIPIRDYRLWKPEDEDFRDIGAVGKFATFPTKARTIMTVHLRNGWTVTRWCLMRMS